MVASDPRPCSGQRSMTAKIPWLGCADYVALKQGRHREIVMELNINGVRSC